MQRKNVIKNAKEILLNVKNSFKVLSATSKESSASSAVPSAPLLPRSAPPFDQLATTSHMLLLRAANSEGSPLGLFSELRVASGFAVRAITGASIESRLGEDSTSCTLFPPCLSRLQATGLNLWDNKECGA